MIKQFFNTIQNEPLKRLCKNRIPIEITTPNGPITVIELETESERQRERESLGGQRVTNRPKDQESKCIRAAAWIMLYNVSEDRFPILSHHSVHSDVGTCPNICILFSNTRRDRWIARIILNAIILNQTVVNGNVTTGQPRAAKKHQESKEERNR